MAGKKKTQVSLNPEHFRLTVCCDAPVVEKNGKPICSFCGKSLCRSTFPEYFCKKD